VQRERRLEHHAPLLVELGLLLVTRRRAHEGLLTAALCLGVHDGSPEPLATLGAAGALRSTGSPPPSLSHHFSVFRASALIVREVVARRGLERLVQVVRRERPFHFERLGAAL